MADAIAQTIYDLGDSLPDAYLACILWLFYFLFIALAVMSVVLLVIYVYQFFTYGG